MLDDAKHFGVLPLLRANLQSKWIKNEVSKPNIGEPRLLQIDAQGKVIKFRCHTTVIAWDSRRKKRHFKSKCFQERCEGAIQLVTKPAASLFYDLVHEGPGIEHNPAPQGDIQILKRNGEHVCAMDLAQCFHRPLSRAGVADAREIGSYVHPYWINGRGDATR